MMERIPQSVALRVILKAYLSDGVTAATGKTIAVVISKNGGAFGNPSAGATNATEISAGWYYVDLSTTDANTTGPLIIRGTATGVDDSERVYEVAQATNAGFSALPNAAAEASGGLPTLSAAQAANGTINTNVHRWLTGTPNALQAGRVDSYVGALAAGVIAAATFAANALDAVWSTAARTLTAFGFGVTTTAADQRASADELLNRDIAGGGSGGARIVRDAIRLLRNKREIALGILTVYQEDDATPAWTAPVVTTAGNPVSSIDPT